MTFCNNCGADVEENQKFCPECGTRLKPVEQKAGASPPPPPPPSEPATPNTVATPPPPPRNNVPPPPPAGSESNVPPPRRKILDRVDIDQEDIDEVTEKAKRGLGAAWRLARKGLNKGAELANQGVEVAKETLEERRARQNQGQPQAPAQPYQAPQSSPAQEDTKYCPNCGQATAGGKFCNHCGHRLE